LNPFYLTNFPAEHYSLCYEYNFGEPSKEIVNSLLKGNSVSSANENSKKMMIKNMKKALLMEEKNEPGAHAILNILWNNYEGQVLLGN
jgi:hypothetical protein